MLKYSNVEDVEGKMTDVDEDSPEVPTKKILDLDSPLENHIITTKDDVTYINMDPVPLSMLEVIDGSDSTTSASLPQKTGNSIGCDEEGVMLVKVAPDPMSMLEVSDNTSDQTGQPSCRIGGHSNEEKSVTSQHSDFTGCCSTAGRRKTGIFC